jgi:hypothetical protein
MEILVNDQPWTGGDIAPSDLLTMVFHDDVAGIGGLGAFTVEVSAGDYVSDPVFHVTWNVIPGSYSVEPHNGGFIVVVSGSNVFAPSPTGDIWEMTFHAPDWILDSDIITISHTAGDWNGSYSPDVMEDVVLHIFPEPCTFLLLGLGGLGLLRKRR